jgi:ribonuclease D
MTTWIDTDAALAEWSCAHPSNVPIGVDTEFMRTNTLLARLALVQLCIGADIALVDVVALGAAAPLRGRLADAATLTIMHSASEDLEAMLPLLPHGPGELFDTQIAAALTGFGFGLSYQKLVAAVLGVDLAKSETRSDWLQRPLSAAQLEYAAQDVAWLPQLHGTLSQKLDELGRSEWLRQDCRALVERATRTAPDPQPQRALRGAAGWPLDRQALLRRLLLWRDASARALDKPKPWVLDDAHALRLAMNPPRSANELFEATRGLRALRGPQREQLLALLQAPLTAVDMDIAPVPAALDPNQKQALDTMKTVVARIAAELDIPDALLCPRRHLETLLGERAWPAALEGWRRALLHDELMRLVP